MLRYLLVIRPPHRRPHHVFEYIKGPYILTMTRGNQREIDRLRAANRHAGKGSATEGDPSKRKEADAKALQEKIAKKKAMEEAAARGELTAAAPAKNHGGGAVKKSTAKG